MKNIVVIGYACMDYSAVLDGDFKGDQTVMIKQRPADAYPRPGGCPLYVARPIASESNTVTIISWVGDDSLGEQFRTSATDAGVNADGIATVSSGRTPVAFMIYQDDGSCGCCFDPGMLGREKLSSLQSDIIREADLVCVTVGPPEFGRRALSLIADSCKVAWVAKNDPRSYPADLSKQLGARADFIFCNHAEREWIDESLVGRERSAPLIIQTAGANPVLVEQGNIGTTVKVPSISVADSTGAGDTLAGGCLRVIADGENDPESIARGGIESAGQLLRSRANED